MKMSLTYYYSLIWFPDLIKKVRKWYIFISNVYAFETKNSPQAIETYLGERTSVLDEQGKNPIWNALRSSPRPDELSTFI